MTRKIELCERKGKKVESDVRERERERERGRTKEERSRRRKSE